VRVERDPTMKVSDPAAYDAELAQRVKRKLKNDTSVTFQIEILPPDTLERAVSKAKRVDDQRPKYRPV